MTHTDPDIAHCIDGRPTTGTPNRTNPVHNPAAGQNTAKAALASPNEITAAISNADHYANGTAISTRDGGAARRFQSDVHVGMVGINVPNPELVAYCSFGGWKSSLFGDAHMYGPEGIDLYTRGKVVTSRWPDSLTSVIDLGLPQNR